MPVNRAADARTPAGPASTAVRRLWLICALLVWSTVLTGTAVIWHQREAAITTAERELINLGIVLAEQTSRTVQSIDLILQEIQSRMAALDVSSPEEFRMRLTGAKTYHLLASLIRNLQQADAVALIDANGKLLNWSRDQEVGDLDLSDRDYFTWLRDHDDEGLFVGLPTKGRATGKHMIFIARRLNGPHNMFLGVEIGLIDTHALEDFYSKISMIPGETVTLLHRDGIVLAGHPDIEQRRGRRMPEQSPWYDRVAAGGGSYHSPGYLSATPQIITVHPLHDYPLVMDVNMSEDAALRAWHRQAIAVGAATVIAAVALIILFGVIVAQFRRQEKQHAKLRAFAALSADWFWEQDADCRFLRDPSVTLAGLSTDVGKFRWDIGDPGMSQDRWAPHKADLDAHRPFRDFRWERIEPDGTRHHFTSSGEPAFDEKGTFVGYRGTGRDITADVRAAEELRSAKDKAEAANLAKSEFLANMGHELRTPLHAIIGFSELIHDQTSGRIGDSYVEWSGDILDSGRHLLDIVNNVLELSRIEAGHYEPIEDRAVLATIARACCAMVRQQAEQGHVRVDCAVGDTVLLADRRAVQQVILNLLSNAVKFTPADGVVSIRAEHSPNGDCALIVADTGIGIDPAALGSIGEPFVQADASKSRKYGGTGLGLAICRKLIALHGGELTIESSSGNGTTVRAIFPGARVVSASQAALPAAQMAVLAI